MNIDVATGAIVFPTGRLDRGETLEQFASQPFAQAAVVSVSNPPWLTYDLWLDDRFIASVVFEGPRLGEVRLMMAGREESEAPWTSEKERMRKRDHDSWLQQQVGPPPHRFSWGTIESVFDERANCSQIILRYL